MKTLVINLKKATERRQFQAAQLQSLGLDYAFFDAINANDADTMRPEAYWRTGQRPLRETEKACFLSHRACWEKVLETGEPMLILEDDALLSDQVPNLLKSLETVQGFDILNLETRARQIFVGTALDDMPNIRPLYLNKDGAAAYILWPNGAQKIIDQSNRVIGLADALLWCNFKLSSFQTYPALAIQSDRCKRYDLPEYLTTKSSNAPTNVNFNKRGNNTWEYFRFRSRRFWGQIHLGKPQLRYFLSVKKEQMPLVHKDFEYLKDISNNPELG